MGRVVARDVLYKLIFENLFVEPQDSVSYTNFLNNSDLDADNLNYVRSSYVEILKEKDNLLKIIEKSINKKQGLQGIFRADLAIIILATYEMIFAISLSFNCIRLTVVSISIVVLFESPTIDAIRTPPFIINLSAYSDFSSRQRKHSIR